MTLNGLFCVLILAAFDTFFSQKGSYGLVTFPYQVPPVLQPQVEDNVTAVSSNRGGKLEYAIAALKAGGEVVTWGDSWGGGDSSAVEAKLRSNVTTIFSSHHAFAALKLGGEVVTWGDSYSGGDSSAVEAKLRSNVTTIVSSPRAFAALKASGEVVTWGQSNYGGDSSAAEAKLRSNVTAIFSNTHAFAALKAGGEVVTWGGAWSGGESSAVEAKLRSNVTTIVSSYEAFAALKASGEVVTWGDSPIGGDSSAVEAKLRSNVTTIFSSPGAFAALKADGEVVTWGLPAYGGDSSAVKAKLRSNVTAIFSSNGAFAALKAGGEVVTWGHPDQGGDSSAVEAKLRSNVTAISSTLGAFAALTLGGEVVTWGHPDYGGNSSAVKADLGSNVTAVFATKDSFAALKTGGEVVIWKDGRYSNDLKQKLKSRVTTIVELPSGFAALICIPGRPTGIDGVSKCELCNPDEYWKGLIDQCGQCEDAIEIPNPDQSACKPCGAGLVPHEKRVCIECPNTTFKKVLENGWPVCEMCPSGAVPLNDKSSCKPCPSDQVAEYGVCKSCAFLSKPSNEKSQCVSDSGALVAAIIYVILVSVLVKFLFMLTSRELVVVDVSLKREKTILTTLKNHNLSSPPWRRRFPIQVRGTGNHHLEDGETVANAKVASSNSLELLDDIGNSINDSGNSIERRLDTSKGIVRLSLTDSFMLVSLRSITPLLLPTMAIIVALPPFALHNFKRVEAGFMTLAAVLASSTVCEYMRRCKATTPLQNKLKEFRVWLSHINPKPTSCPKGAGRAIRLDKLLDTHDFFRSFIQLRNAYYLSANILQPLTADHRLSYAELVGPEQVDFFVSHFWGTEFSHFCASLQKHAEMTITPEPDCTVTPKELSELHMHRHHVAYWICFCSNNQYDVHHELGGDAGWKESSFYLALQSPSCHSSCMVLDNKSLTLTRSWCIFETLQALKLSKSRPGFELLMCTSSGVLNSGNASVEAAMGVVKCVSGMDLQNAEATREDDKQMIDQLVIDEMGSFDALNSFICDEIHTILEEAQKACSLEFDSLNKVLETSRQKHSVLQASLYGCALEEVGDSHPSAEMPRKKAELLSRMHEIQKKIEEKRQEREIEQAELQMKKQKLEEQLEELSISLV